MSTRGAHQITPSGVIARYRRFLPITPKTPVITLGEGSTPLVESRYVSRRLGITLYYKYEGVNPTGSFKDRGMTVAISKALEEGATGVICASTGNTSSSAAAYAAAAGVPCYVVLPAHAIASGKLTQTLMYGATVLAIKGSFDDALAIVRRIGSSHPGLVLVNSVNPYRLEGQKTAAFEVCDALGKAPAYHALPVGNAGNMTAYWMGYTEYAQRGEIRSRPKMIGVQAKGADPIVRGRPIAHPRTVASAINIGHPVSWERAVRARDESSGTILSVSNAQILSAYRLLAHHEGLFVEPASAAALAGVLVLAARRTFSRRAVVVCTLTGHGLKDPDRAVQSIARPITLPATETAVRRALGLRAT